MATIAEVHPAGVSAGGATRAGLGRRTSTAPVGTGRGGHHRMVVVALVAVAAVAALVAMDRVAVQGAPETATGTTTLSPIPVADFLPRADDVCVAFARSTAAIGFRPASQASDTADALSRIVALDQAAAVLNAMAPPVTDPGLIGRVLHDISGARATAEAVVAAESAAIAHSRWGSVDPTIAGAFAPLASAGASRCRF